MLTGMPAFCTIADIRRANLAHANTLRADVYRRRRTPSLLSHAEL